MTRQAVKVLDYLRKVGEDTDSNMARILGHPAPSIRRSIQELQDSGIHVSYLGKNGGYRLVD